MRNHDEERESVKRKGGIIKRTGVFSQAHPKLAKGLKIGGISALCLIVATGIVAAVIFLYPYFHTLKGSDVAPILDRPPAEYSMEIEIDENGNFVDNPVPFAEIEYAKEFVCDFVSLDLKTFNKGFSSIDKISAIYKHNLYANDPQNVDEVGTIDILFEKNGKQYILEYVGLSEDFKEGIPDITGLNDADVINNLSSTLSKCYLSNLYECENVGDTKNGSIVANALFIKERDCYIVPVYSKNKVEYLSISRQALADNSDEVSCEGALDLFKETLNNKSSDPLFSKVSTDQIFQEHVSKALNNEIKENTK